MVEDLTRDAELVCYAQYDAKILGRPYKFPSRSTVLAPDEANLGGAPGDSR